MSSSVLILILTNLLQAVSCFSNHQKGFTSAVLVSWVHLIFRVSDLKYSLMSAPPLISDPFQARLLRLATEAAAAGRGPDARDPAPARRLLLAGAHGAHLGPHGQVLGHRG